MRTIAALPFECALCHRWPCQNRRVIGLCERCVDRHAHAPQFLTPPGLDACAAAVAFDTPWAALIARYKFAPEPGLARPLATLMHRSDSIRQLITRADWLIPLPLANERLAQRGFNQSLLLAQHLITWLSLEGPRSASPRIDSTALVRTRHTAQQRTLSRSARVRNVANAFALQPAPAHRYGRANGQNLLMKGKHIVLLDDVMTTGATLEAAAAPLRLAGAASVSAIVLARTPLHSSH